MRALNKPSVLSTAKRRSWCASSSRTMFGAWGQKLVQTTSNHSDSAGSCLGARGWRIHLSILLAFLTLLSAAMPLLGQTAPGSWTTKPYRVLLVVGRWNDPAGLFVDSQADDFQPVAALLKSWLVPFDILRMDQQQLDASYLFERSGTIRYGLIIWLADPASYEAWNLESLREAVHAGTSLLAAGSRVLHPVLEELLGLKFKEVYTSVEAFRVVRPHFITRELASKRMDPWKLWTLDTDNRLWVETRTAEVLIAQERHPVMTARPAGPGSSALWMGIQRPASLRDSPYWRGLFQRSLVWGLGYLVLPDIDYQKRVILVLDDWGSTEKSLHASWRYPTLTEEQIEQRLIAPLKVRQEVAVAATVSGFLDRKTKRVVSPWTRKFVDPFGVLQDFPSTQRGLQTALMAGVLEIQSHGWTHMQPDLDSPPGPWWTADLGGEGSAWGWFTEFEDSRRSQEVPAVAQLFHMKQSREHLRQDFGQAPLLLALPGGAWSKSYANHTPRLAAQAGFGITYAGGRAFYLDRDLIVDLAGISREVLHGAQNLFPFIPEQWPPHPDGPIYLAGHDRDLFLEPGYLDWFFSALPAGTRTMGMNHYVAILHTEVGSSATASWQLTFNFNPEYCRYFSDRASSWRMLLSDPVLEELEAAKALNITVDNRPVTKTVSKLAHASLVIEIPKGLGKHVWKLEVE